MNCPCFASNARPSDYIILPFKKTKSYNIFSKQRCFLIAVRELVYQVSVTESEDLNIMGFYANVIFPWLLNLGEPKEMAELRIQTLRDIKGEILEIGMGTGANLSFYPKAIKKIIAAEPSQGMNIKAKKKADALGIKVEFYQVSGERLPFEDGTFDSVVNVDVLCTAEDVKTFFNEVYRVLKPGGKYYFLDHGISQEGKICRWQYRLNALNKIIACGCELTRDIEKHIRNTNFIITDLTYIPPFTGINAIYTHIRGIAVKPM